MATSADVRHKASLKAWDKRGRKGPEQDIDQRAAQESTVEEARTPPKKPMLASEDDQRAAIERAKGIPIQSGLAHAQAITRLVEEGRASGVNTAAVDVPLNADYVRDPSVPPLQPIARGSLTRERNLTPEQLEVQERFLSAIEDDPQGMVDAYMHLSAARKPGTFFCSPDDAKELCPEYASSNMGRTLYAAAAHEGASALAKMAYRQALRTPIGPEAQAAGVQRVALLSAGTPGAGKSTAIENMPEMKKLAETAHVTYDSTLGGGSGIDRIREGVDTAHDVKIMYVARTTEDAYMNGVIPRGARTGRTTTPENVISAASSASKNFNDFQSTLGEKYPGKFTEDNFIVIDNRHGKGNAIELPRGSKAPSVDASSDLADKLHSEIDKRVAEGKLNATTARGLHGVKFAADRDARGLSPRAGLGVAQDSPGSKSPNATGPPVDPEFERLHPRGPDGHFLEAPEVEKRLAQGPMGVSGVVEVKPTREQAMGVQIGKKARGQCYEQAGRYLLHPAHKSAQLVHGTVDTGLPLGHAWAEMGDTIFDGTEGRFYDRKSYYSKMNAKAEKRYTASDAAKRAVRSKHWGPWHETGGFTRGDDGGIKMPGFIERELKKARRQMMRQRGLIVDPKTGLLIKKKG